MHDGLQKYRAHLRETAVSISVVLLRLKINKKENSEYNGKEKVMWFGIFLTEIWEDQLSSLVALLVFTGHVTLMPTTAA